MNLRRLTLFELKDKFLKGEVSAVEIVKAYFQRLMLAESKVKAYITTAKKDALVKEANELDYSLSKWRKTMPLMRSEEHTSELQSQSNLVCRLLLEKKKTHILKPASLALST